MTERSCGTCHKCCIHTPVAAFNKPADTPCLHLNVLQSCGACGIYNERPSECRAYRCSWLDGSLAEELKPDECGLLLETVEIFHPKPLKLLLGFENEPGAIERAAAVLNRSVVNGKVAIIINHSKTEPTIFGEPDDIAAYNTFIDECRRRGGVTHSYGDGVVIQETIGD
jgi:Fe-S-cluster containining protein